ncbi:MAG: anaerobic sulfatase maturase [Planctomycetes bacterium]|nr:anaerobic sulfatase maturase [Planctomycetota bacterium]
MRPFTLLIKPVSADCNLRCPYCFYLGHEGFYPEERAPRMSDATLERIVAGYMATDQPQHVFAWQGGEPTLMGTEFFRRVTELQMRHGRAGSVVANGVQTNATRITDELARHFGEYRFLVGVSLDGPSDLHDRYRRNAAGRGSHAEVMGGIDRLRRHGVEFNILTLVSDANVRKPREVYRYLLENRFLFHQYIPCVESDGSGKPQPFSIGGEGWGEFLCGIYDLWIAGDTRRVSVRLFDSILNALVDGRPSICHMDRDCRQYFAIEYNGDVFPCDFYVERPLKLGNVFEHSWEDLWDRPAFASFGRRKAEWNPSCEGCPYLPLCAGDCLKHRGDGALSRLCAGWKRFYDHALPGFRGLAEEIRRERIRTP